MEKYWLYGLGFFAQSLFRTRMMFQRFHSENKEGLFHTSGYWKIILAAPFLFLAFYRVGPVLITAQGMGVFVSVRNIFICIKSYSAA